MASLRARHSRACALGGVETRVVDSGKVDGCNCHPTYAIRHHAGDNKYLTKRLDPPANKQLAKARGALARFEADAQSGAAVLAERIRFRDWGEIWLASRADRKRSPATLAEYATTLAYANSHLGDKWLHEIRPPHIEAFRQTLLHVSATTRNKHLRILRACFAWAVKQEKLVRNPVASDDNEVETTMRGSYFTSEEIAKIAKAMPEGVYRVFFLTALRTGMRASELITLRWKNVDTDAAVIRVRESLSRGQAWAPKTQASRREIYIDAVTAKMLADWRAETEGQPDEQVFRRPDGRVLSNEDATKRVLYPAMKKAGVPRADSEGVNRVFHSIRDTYAATVLAADKSMYWLAKQLGHSSMQITEQRYAHLEPKERAKQAADLGDKFAA